MNRKKEYDNIVYEMSEEYEIILHVYNRYHLYAMVDVLNARVTLMYEDPDGSLHDIKNVDEYLDAIEKYNKLGK